jgi:hypothetical protein
VSSIIDSMICNMLRNPTSELGWEADEAALADTIEVVNESVQMPTPGDTVVVTFCTDGSRSAQVRAAATLPAASPCSLRALGHGCDGCACTEASRDQGVHSLQAASLGVHIRLSGTMPPSNASAGVTNMCGLPYGPHTCRSRPRS